jgi:lysophospholipase L1-like esterase
VTHLSLAVSALLLLLMQSSPGRPAHAPAAAATPLRIAFLGDSLTIGLHASSPETMYRSLLLDRLEALHAESRAFAVFQDPYGMTDDALARVDPLLDWDPDVVVLEIGHHEVFAPESEVALFEARYERLLGLLQGSGASVIAGTLAWLNYAPGSAEFATAQRLNATIRALCARRGIAVADLWGATLNRSDYLSRLADSSFIPPFIGDDYHPNDAGHRALAEAFWTAYRGDRARRLLRAQAVPTTIPLGTAARN